MKATMRQLKRPAFLAAALLFLIPAFQALSEGDSTKATTGATKITLRDGSELIGTIINQGTDSLDFRMASNLSIRIAAKEIESTEPLSGFIEDGRYRRVDPNRSRLFLSPTARPLKGGEAYVSDIMVFFPYLAVGLGDYVSIGGGMTLFPGAPSQLYYLAPKVSVPIGGENIHLAGGVLYSNITAGDFDGVGMAYGMVTAGSPYASLTLGVGKGFAAGSFAESPTIMVGGEAQISNSIAIISENWFPTGSDAQLLSFGLRFFGEHLSADLGFIHVLVSGESTEGFPMIPWIGFSYHFGK